MDGEAHLLPSPLKNDCDDFIDTNAFVKINKDKDREFNTEKKSDVV